MSTQATERVGPGAPASPPPRLRSLGAAARGRGLVERRRLLRPLVDATSVALLTAPTGYGKTTLLRQWADGESRRFVWASVDNTPDHRALLREAVAEWSAISGRAVLVVDDAHLLQTRTARALLAQAAQQADADHVLAIASRTRPVLALGRMRTENRLVELGAHDLAMTQAEAGMLLKRAGAPQPPEALPLLYARTEGWPAGLRLAAAALREQGNGPEALAAFAGDDCFIADYLREELVPLLTRPQLSFLRRTSILERLSGPLCDAVLDRTDSGEMLHELARADVMLTPIDRAEETFRCHPLFSDLLQADLRRLEPEGVTAGHGRASVWHEAHGDLEQAISHAVAAGDIDRSSRLLWSVVPRYAFDGRASSLESWLGHFRGDDIAAYPELAMTAAVARVMNGDRDDAERLAAVAELTMGDASVARRRALEPALWAVRAAVGRHGIDRMAQDAEHARKIAGPGAWSSLACLLAGTARQLREGGDGQRELLEEGERQAGAGAARLQALCLTQLAAPALIREDLEEALGLMERARACIGGDGAEAAEGAPLVMAASSLAHALDGPVSAARREAVAAQKQLDAMRSPAPWYDAETRLLLARTHLRLSDAAAARKLLAEAGRILGRTPEATVLHAWLDDAWGRADSFAEGSVTGPAILTTAELRVLRFLPSHLSFREIALRLHVSANTVKTHAHAVYRKLDASSRSEAVHRARAVGLVDA